MGKNERPIFVQSDDTCWGATRFAGTRITLVNIIAFLQVNTVKEALECWPYLKEHKRLLTAIRGVVKQGKARP